MYEGGGLMFVALGDLRIPVTLSHYRRQRRGVIFYRDANWVEIAVEPWGQAGYLCFDKVVWRKPGEGYEEVSDEP